MEEKRATLSVPKTTAASLLRELKNADLATSEIPLSGAFHCERHRDDTKLLSRIFDSNPAFTLPDAPELAFPTISNTGESYITTGKLHEVLAHSMLVEQSNWQQAFAALHSSTLNADSIVVAFGSERCVPPGLARKLGPRLVQVTGFDLDSALLPASLLDCKGASSNKGSGVSDDAIAVIGMSCQLPGAADLKEFWDAICAGKSQHVEVPEDRFDFETTWRERDPKRKWYGNFIQDYDAFDYKFFKKSPREISSTDPQHRLILQAAYQAVEQSGYFNMTSQDTHIGCYIGVGLVDYENNIACYQPTAYSATGNLKSFAAGKISHYFGWTGPGLSTTSFSSKHPSF